MRRLASRCGALLPFGQAAAALADLGGIQLSARTVRTVTQTVGVTREQAIQDAITRAWAQGWTASGAPPPHRCSIAMDGVRILRTDGEGREVTVGRVVPVRATTQGAQREPSQYAAGLEPADAFGRRLAVVAHTVQAETASRLAVLGDGAAWIWHLADEPVPHAVQIVDGYHASERVSAQLARLARGEAATLATEWATLPLRGEAATVRDGQVTSVTTQASRMASPRSRAAGWDSGSGMIESSCTTVIGQREQGSGMRWSDPGAQTAANVRGLLFNHEWDDYGDAA